MEKLVVKTAVKTVLIILSVLVVIFAVFNFAFPQHMATLTEGMGNYNLAIKYASLRYYYTKDCEDLARCFDDAVLLKDDEYVLQFGVPLKDHRDFAAVCESKNRSIGGGYDYRHYALGKIAVSYYNKGEKEKAVALAFDANGYESFAYGNAAMSLCAVALSANDAEACRLLMAELIKVTCLPGEETDYLTIKNRVDQVAKSGN